MASDRGHRDVARTPWRAEIEVEGVVFGVGVSGITLGDVSIEAAETYDRHE